MARPARMSYQDATFAYFDRPQFPYSIGSAGIFEGEMPFEAYAALPGARAGRAASVDASAGVSSGGAAEVTAP